VSAPGRILIVCAIERELAGFAVPEAVDLLACGVGPVDAAVAVARALAGGAYRAVISAGIGGVYQGRGAVGDAVAVIDERLADFGLEGGAPLALPDGHALAERVAAAPELVRLARHAGLRLARGLTVTLVTTTEATARARRDRYGVDVESMEGFAVLRAAALAGVPAIELRGISNVARERTLAGWNFSAGAQATLSALRTLVPSLLPR